MSVVEIIYEMHKEWLTHSSASNLWPTPIHNFHRNQIGHSILEACLLDNLWMLHL